MAQNRRAFLQTSVASLTTLSTLSNVNRTLANEPVIMGRSQLNATRLGFGAGDGKNGFFQKMGQDKFTHLVRYAYDQGIRYFDLDAGPINAMMGNALKGLDRETYTLITQFGRPKEEELSSLLPKYLKCLNTEYIDGILITSISKENWSKEFAAQRNILSQAKEQGLIKAHGASVHGLEGLKTLPFDPWVDLVMVSVNHKGNWMDAPRGIECTAAERREYSVPVIKQIHQAGIGVAGMKVFSSNGFENAIERRNSLQFVQNLGAIDTMPIKFESQVQLDEVITMLEAM